MMSQTLLKCPHCGSHEIEEGYFYYKTLSLADRSGWYGYRCKRCGRKFKDKGAEE